MFDGFFSKTFKAAKCKTLLKLAVPRIRLLRNRRDIQIRQMRRDIARLLETGQESTARIRVEHVMREENTVAAHEMVELFCELVAARLPILEAQRECPLDVKEAVSSLCFAAPRCADLPELMQLQILFSLKYGRDFVSSAVELLPDCAVNRRLIELLSVRAPPPHVKLSLLKDIAQAHNLDWDPSPSPSHDDLLDVGTKLPLPPSTSNDDDDGGGGDIPRVPLEPQPSQQQQQQQQPLPQRVDGDEECSSAVHLQDVIAAARAATESAERAAAAARSAATLAEIKISEMLLNGKHHGQQWDDGDDHEHHDDKQENGEGHHPNLMPGGHRDRGGEIGEDCRPYLVPGDCYDHEGESSEDHRPYLIPGDCHDQEGGNGEDHRPCLTPGDATQGDSHYHSYPDLFRPDTIHYHHGTG